VSGVRRLGTLPSRAFGTARRFTAGLNEAVCVVCSCLAVRVFTTVDMTSYSRIVRAPGSLLVRPDPDRVSDFTAKGEDRSTDGLLILHFRKYYFHLRAPATLVSR
jgi:hypothetical protein